MRKALALLSGLALFASVLVAHGGDEHVMGTITKITGKSITVETKDKKSIEVRLTPDTKYVKGEQAAALKELKVGDRVVINAKKSGDKLVATMVKIGEAPPAHKH